MKKLVTLSTLIATLASASAMAVDANITFNGTVDANTCTISAADATKVLTIPSVTPATLLAAANNGYLTYNASGSFEFSSCPAGLTKVISSYKYQGTVLGTTIGIATGSASNIALVVMQATKAAPNAVVNVNGSSGTLNEVTIANNTATVPVIVGIWAANSSGTATLPTVGNYSGVYTVGFTYS